MKKRILSILLVLLMVMSMLPMTALAATNEIVYSDAAAALTATGVAATKTVTANADGTYTITLSVTGKTDTETSTQNLPADVVLVVDTSTSMDYPVSETLCGGTVSLRIDGLNSGWYCEACGTQYLWRPLDSTCDAVTQRTNRLDVAKSAAHQFVTGLLNASNDIRIGLYDFSGSNRTNLGLTSNATTLHNAIDALAMPENGDGTNYDVGLSGAESILNSSESERAKFIVFLSDGEPHQGNGVGTARRLKANGVTIFTVGIDVDRDAADALRAISSRTPTDGYYYYTASSSGSSGTALNDVLAQIQKEIESMIPAGTNAVMTDFINTDSFEYVSADSGLTYNDADGRLTWNIGELTDETQTVTFTVRLKDGNTEVGQLPTNKNVELTFIAPNGDFVRFTEDAIGKPTVGVYKVTYTDGVVSEEVFADKVFYNLRSGEATPAFGDDPTREGYKFAGWDTDVAETISGSEYAIVYTAQWTPKTYTVSYNANGGDGAPASQTKTHDVDLTLSSNQPTRTGYTFSGWNTAENGTGTSYAAGATYTNNANLTLYAQWTANTYTVTYNANGGEGAPASQTKTHDVDLTLSSGQPTRTGYTFSGWNTAENGTGTSYAAGATYTNNADLTLYAQWTANTSTDYKVEHYTQNLEDEDFSLADTELLTGTTDENVTATPKTFSGFTFDENVEGTVKSGSVSADSLLTLKLYYTRNTYTVTYDLAGGSTTSDQYVFTGVKYGAPTPKINNPTKQNYIFTGWDKNIADTVTANVTYTARWELIPVASLSVTKTANNTKASVGDTISWDITVTNTGDVELYDVTLSDTLNAAGDATLYDANGRALSANFKFDLAVGNAATFTAKYTVKPADAGKTIYNTVVASAGETSGKGESGGTEIRPNTPIIPMLPVLNTEDHVAYIIGYADDTVRPENNITRAEVATIFFRLLSDDSRAYYWTQKNDYSDVSRGDWFNNAVSTLSNAGIITGYPDGTFRPNAPITRAEFAAIAARFSDTVYSGKNTFSDVPSSHWAARCIALAEHLGWVSGYPDGTFRPDKSITRAEAMTLINRVLDRAVDAKHMLPGMVTWRDNSPSAWYYEDVQEATNSHEYTRLTSVIGHQGIRYESWTKILPVPDWDALEKSWSTAYTK